MSSYHAIYSGCQARAFCDFFRAWKEIAGHLGLKIKKITKKIDIFAENRKYIKNNPNFIKYALNAFEGLPFVQLVTSHTIQNGLSQPWT
jgi:hypothetical protein